MTDKECQRRYYQGLADLYMIAGSLAVLNSRMKRYKIDCEPAADQRDLVDLARLASRCIARGPERFHHVIEESPDIQAIWQQFAG